MVSCSSRRPGVGEPAGEEFTRREVLQLLAEGHSMKQIGRILKITPRTVAFHKYAMMEQLGIESAAELVQFAAQAAFVLA